MKATSVIISVVGVIGVGALGYYAYTRSRGQQVLLPAGTQPLLTNSQSPTPNTQSSNAGYPDKSTLLKVVQANGWNSAYFNAINATYNQQTGQARHGDWVLQVIGVNPVAIKFNKGAETFTLTSANLNGFNSKLLR